MKSKKDIGKFFKENLDQLNFTPSNLVWDDIEKDLKEKKKKRRIFIWFFIAAFIGGSITTYTLMNYDDLINSNLTIPKNSNPSKANPNSKSLKNSDFTTKEQTDSINKSESAINNSGSYVNNSDPTINKSSSESIKNTNPKKSASKENSKVSPKNQSIQIVRNSVSKNKNYKNNSIVTYSEKGKQKQKTNSKKTKTDKTNQLYLVENSKENNSSENVLDSVKTSSELITKVNKTTTELDSLKKKKNKLTEKEKSLSETKKDSVKELVEDKNFEITIAPYFGYAFSGKFGSDNSLSKQYNVLDEGGKMTQNFGVLVRWMGSEKLGIQTGIGMVQSTRFIEVQKNSTLFSNNLNLELDFPLETYTSLFQNDEKIKFIEENSYIEIPLEAYYVWSKRKFGLASSFGVSIFITNKNQIYLESENVNKFQIGFSKNITSQSLTANAKLNLFYKLSKRIQLDLYPEFQFQIMSHTDTPNFYPYYLSFKTGLSYKL